MKNFLWRFAWYLVGIGIGIILVLIFFGNRDIEFNYLPEARVKKNILKKNIRYSPNIIHQMKTFHIDSSNVLDILHNGSIVFSKSNPRKKPCGEYYFKKKWISLSIKNCDSTAYVFEIQKEYTK